MTPLVDALRACVESRNAPFYTPGHKRGKGSPIALSNLLGSQLFQADLPELPELDNLFAPQGAIQAAQDLAAQTFGAEQTWFLANGSTCGILAAVLATCEPGAKLILPRNVHQSAISALILSGAVPIFITPEYDAERDIAHSITPESVAIALTQHPDAKAVLMVYPTYYGMCGDIRAIADLAHQYNIPLLVDEAHGAHFAFHPDLPISALAAGADLTVQSTHKTLSALTQASMLHVQGDRINRDRISQSLQFVQSSSPSYLLLASLDAARDQMATQGEALMERTLQLADEARSRIQALGFSTLEASDRTRLTVTVSDLGIDGFTADEILHERLGVTAELPSFQNLTFIISLGNTQEDVDRLAQSFAELRDCRGNAPVLALPHASIPNHNSHSTSPQNFQFSQPAIPPREAFFSPTETVNIAQSIDRISAELICPYPPGIPVLMPGDRITPGAIATLQTILNAGGYITGCSDPTLQTLRVI